jgi:putative membrane protein
MLLTEQEHALISDAAGAVERQSDGEVLTIVAARSDSYHDVALHYSVLAMLLVPALLGSLPNAFVDRVAAMVMGWNAEFSRGALMLSLMALLALAFLLARLLLLSMNLRMALTPGSTKSRRVHRRAIALFRTGCEQKTRGRTGILIYLSVAEHRAEIVADQAIADQVEPEVWGEAMAVLIAEVKAGRPGQGMARAVEEVGKVLIRILPPTADNPNELPDRVIEL